MARTIPLTLRDQRRRISARTALESLGGLAGAKAIAEVLGERAGADLSVRQVRDRLRNTGGAVRKLGAGYYATRAHEVPRVLEFVERLLERRGTCPAEEVASEVLRAYPHGDTRAVMAWLAQDPGRVIVRNDTVWLDGRR